MFLYFSVAIAPVFIILAYIYVRDKYNKEPVGLLIKCLVGGMVSVIPVLIFGLILSLFLPAFGRVSDAFFQSFFIAALNEEFFKFLFVMAIAWNSVHFDERFDGIVYAVYVSLGFALVENILYVFSAEEVFMLGNIAPQLELGILRAFTAVPAHAIFGITMGYFIGMAKFNREKRGNYLILALLIPILLHGFYNFVLFMQEYWLLFVFLGYLIFLYIFGFRKIGELAKYKKELENHPDYVPPQEDENQMQ